MRSITPIAALLLCCSTALAQFGGGGDAPLPHPPRAVPPIEIPQERSVPLEKIGTVVPVSKPDPIELVEQEQALFEKVRSTKVSFTFEQNYLIEAIQELERRTDVPIRIDTLALEEIGLTSKAQVSLALENVSLHSALVWMLRQHELTYIVAPDAIVVTTPAGAETHLKTRYYPVSELLENPPYYEDLIDVITTIVAPDSWEELGGPGSLAPLGNGLMVAQTDEIHWQIERVLAGLKELQTLPSDAYPTAAISISVFPDRKRAILEHLHTTQVTLDRNEVSLVHQLEVIRKHLTCPLLVDQQGLHEIAVRLTPEVEVVIPPATCSLAQTLNVLTESADLDWYVADELIVITSRERSEIAMEIGLYPVRDLAWKGIDVGDPRLQDSGDAMNSTSMFHLDDPTSHDALYWLPDHDALINALTTTVQPDSWEDLGGPASVAWFGRRADCLLIAQTERIHQKIQTTLTQIRAAQKPVDIDKLLAEIKQYESQVVTRTYSIREDSTKEPPFSRDDLNQFYTRIREQIAPQSWDGAEHYIEGLGNMIVVRHSRHVQRQVRNHLIELGVISLPNFTDYRRYGFASGRIPQTASATTSP